MNLQCIIIVSSRVGSPHQNQWAIFLIYPLFFFLPPILKNLFPSSFVISPHKILTLSVEIIL